MNEENETPTLSEAFEQASESLTSTTDEAQPVTEESQKTQSDVSTEEPTPEVVKESSETPLDKFDLESLSPELQQVYKDMQKGFTQGRQKDREEVNELKKELAELKRQNQPDPKEEWKNLTEEQRIEKLADQKVLETKLKDFRETAIKEYQEMDSRLNDSNEEKYDELMDTAISTQLDKMLEDHIAINGNELGFDYKSHAKKLIKQWDDRFNNYFDQKLLKQKEMAKKKVEKNMKVNPKASTKTQVNPNTTMSFEDAYQAALNKNG